jgi:hypothetical protein
MAVVEQTTVTPPELARRWRVKPERVCLWIKSGELRAFDVSSQPGVGRPRYRIPQDAIIEFENRRSAAQVKSTRQRRTDLTVQSEDRCAIQLRHGRA